MSIRFNVAESDHIIVGANPISGLSSYTYLCKYRPISLVTIANLISVGNSGTDGSYNCLQCRQSGPACHSEQNHSAVFDSSNIAGTINLNEWSTFSLVVTAGSAVSRLNNAADATPATFATAPATWDRFIIGRFSGVSPDGLADGYMAQIAIIKRALTTAELTDWHLGLAIDKIPTIVNADIAVYWKGDSTTPTVNNTGGTVTVNGATVDSTINPTILDYTPVLFGSVPRVHVETEFEAEFEALFFSGMSHIAMLGDSTRAEIGGSGMKQMAWRRWLWHQFRGHSPATPWIPPNVSIGGDSTQVWLTKAVTVDGQNVNADYADADFPPSFELASQKRTYKNAGDSGYFFQLNHRNDNEATAHALGNDTSDYPAESGFDVVPAAAAGGSGNFDAGTMFGAKSFIDADTGLKLEVIALTSPTGADNVYWANRPMNRLHAQQVDAVVKQTGTLFGVGDSTALAAAAGTAYKRATPVLTDLSGGELWHQLQIAGNTAVAGESVWTIAARIVSDNETGIAMTCLAVGGYYSDDFLLTHPDCGFILTRMDFDAFDLAYGTNDAGLVGGQHPATFYQNTIDLIDFIRDTMGDPDFPIILEAPPYRTGMTNSGSFSPAGDYYASVLYHIAQALDHVMFVNVRRITNDDYAWNAANQATFTTDGVHYTDAGSEAIARSAVQNGVARYFGEALSEGGGSGSAIVHFAMPLNVLARRRSRLNR